MLCLSFSLTGCCLKQVPPSKIDCPAPLKPDMSIMGHKTPDQENMKLLLYNMNAIIEYSLKQESTIKCFQDSLK